MIAQRSQADSGSSLDVPSANRSWAILADLQTAHVRLLASIKDLAKITVQPQADKVEYSAVRFRVSEASLARRIVFRAACDHLFEIAPPAQQETIRRLRNADAELAQLTSQHVHQWTGTAVDQDWEGYCVCSKEIRSALLKQVELERGLLYPLLHQHGSNPRRDFRLIPIDQFLAEETAVS